jgi:hypothetical protein
VVNAGKDTPEMGRFANFEDWTITKFAIYWSSASSNRLVYKAELA